jgi:hypothetical protein
MQFGNQFVLCAMPPTVMHRFFAETILHGVLPVFFVCLAQSMCIHA